MAVAFPSKELRMNDLNKGFLGLNLSVSLCVCMVLVCRLSCAAYAYVHAKRKPASQPASLSSHDNNAITHSLHRTAPHCSGNQDWLLLLLLLLLLLPTAVVVVVVVRIPCTQRMLRRMIH